jgi:hypothetical protein
MAGRGLIAALAVICLLAAGCDSRPAMETASSSPAASPLPAQGTGHVPSGSPLPGGFLAVNASNQSTCAIRLDQTVACWGDIFEAPPAGAFLALDGDTELMCGIRVGGGVECWSYGESVPMDGAFTKVSTGEVPCGIRIDGTIACVGEAQSFATPPSGRYLDLAMSFEGGCALTIEGEIACWPSDMLAADPPSGAFVDIDLGPQACAIRTDSSIACWGSYMPDEPPPPAGGFTAIDGGGAFCGIRVDRTLACWGLDEDGVGLLDVPDGTFSSVSVGGRHACAIRTDASLVCWGSDESGQVNPAPFVSIQARWSSGNPTPPHVTTELEVEWEATSVRAPVWSYDVRYRAYAWNASPEDTPFITWQSRTLQTEATLSAEPGQHYEIEARANLTDGTTSEWTATFILMPIDDREFARSDGWTEDSGEGLYGSTASRASRRGEVLSLDGYGLWGVALIATTCPGCGTVDVYRGDTLVGTVSLHSDRRLERVVLYVASLDEEYEGDNTLTIRVASRDRPVIIDGVIRVED